MKLKHMVHMVAGLAITVAVIVPAPTPAAAQVPQIPQVQLPQIQLPQLPQLPSLPPIQPPQLLVMPQRPDNQVCTETGFVDAACQAHVVDDANGKPLVTTGPSGYGPAQFHTAYNLPTTTASKQIIAL